MSSTATAENPLHRLSRNEIDEIGEKFQQIHDDVYADLGQRDRDYIQNIVQLHRRMAAIGRIELLASRYTPALILGTLTLGAAKIIENMEIGHNVMHGQWDWMNDPQIHSSVWDWDTASPAAAWKHSHNYVHHTYTNVIGKDKDVGYEIMRVDPTQPWHPVFVLQPLYNVLLAAGFEWGVAFHDLDFEAIKTGAKPKEQLRDELKAIGLKARRQIVKDYIAFPALSGKSWKRTLKANFIANLMRNFWTYAIIFCGHFPDQAYTFTEEEWEADQSKGAWYIRQLLGAVNIDGGPTFHFFSGNLSFQVEHHLYPDLPSSRYAEISPRVKAICQEHGLPYNTGRFSKQFGMVQRTILRLAFPGGKVRPKAGPWKEPDSVDPSSNGQVREAEGALGAFP